MHDSIADLKESDLIRQILADEHWRQRLIGLHGIPDDSELYPEVSLEGLERLEGDIDLLLVPPGKPEYSTAIQVKRVKVSESSFATDAPNKLAELKKLKQQANPLDHVGFWQVYCFVLVAVDSRSHNAGVFTYAGLTPSLRAKIDDAISLQSLSDRVGLIHYEFVQPIDGRPLGAGTYFARPKRIAKPMPQPSMVTEWVRQAVLRKNA
ncbi:MAG: hypothetical protein ACREUX_08370 [Burkholderiales bacterium]